MLKKIAAGLIAATMLASPVLIAGSAQAAAPAHTTTAAKPDGKAMKMHRKHVRFAARHGARYVKVVRHGKTTWVRVKASKYHVKHVKQAAPQSKPIKRGAA